MFENRMIRERDANAQFHRFNLIEFHIIEVRWKNNPTTLNSNRVSSLTGKRANAFASTENKQFNNVCDVVRVGASQLNRCSNYPASETNAQRK